jgi:uncharacterized membrane protein
VSGFVPALLVAVLLAAAGPRPAWAAFSVCNKTAHAASVALGFYDGMQWSSRGWFRVEAGGCTRLVDRPLPARYYYLYASHSDVGGAWDGDSSFCIATGSFHIQGRMDCLAKGYQVRKFFQVDTGQSPDWTENLAD